MTHPLSAQEALDEIATMFGMTDPHASDVVLAVRMLLDAEESRDRVLSAVVDILEEREPEKPRPNHEAIDAALRAAERAVRDKWTIAERDLALARADAKREALALDHDLVKKRVQQLQASVAHLERDVSQKREDNEFERGVLRKALRAIGTALGVHPMGHRSFVVLAKAAESLVAERDRLRAAATGGAAATQSEETNREHACGGEGT